MNSVSSGYLSLFWAIPKMFEEAMQDTFVRAFRHLDQFRKESRFSTWLTRIAVNQAIETRKRRKSFATLSEAAYAEEQFPPKRYESWQENPEQLYGKQELRRVVEDAIRSLPTMSNVRPSYKCVVAAHLAVSA
jgi:RNA polymerase sigma factor (sigma-70 family)